jgi:hypothetical protein
MPDTPQRFPRAGSQAYSSPAAELGTAPRQTILRLYSPLEP